MKTLKILLSDYAVADSDVINGGGTDRTAEVQAVLNMANESTALHITVDGAYLTGKLRVGSHTTIECLNEACGFYLKDNANDALIENRNCDTYGRKDRDIRLIGGTYNFNCINQKHHNDCNWDDNVDVLKNGFVVGIRLFGIYGVTISGLVLRNQRTFALVCGNVEHFLGENIRIDLPDIMYAENQDGLHFFGPSRFIVLRNISGCAGDDFIAFAPDEMDGKSSITDVLVDGVMLDDSDQGIRLLSHGKGTLDRVLIRNVTGTYKSYGFYINPWISQGYKPDERYGNYGHIRIENVMLKKEGSKYDYTKPMCFRLGGVIKHLEVENVVFENVTEPADFMQIGGHYTLFDGSPCDCKTEIGTLKLKNITVESAEGVETRCVVMDECTIHTYLTENIAYDGEVTVKR